MSEKTIYQEGVIILSSGVKIPFLCRPLSQYVEEEEMEKIVVADIHFFPEIDRSEEITDEVLRDKIDDLPEKPDFDEEPGLDDKLDSGVGWDDAY